MYTNAVLQAFYLLVILVNQTYPEILGPYEREECEAEKEFLIARGYEVSNCELLPIPQEAKYIVVPYLP